MMDQPATAAVEQFVKAGYPLDAKAILLIESDGTPEEVAEEIQRVRAVMESAGATEIQIDELAISSRPEEMQLAAEALGRITAALEGKARTWARLGYGELEAVMPQGKAMTMADSKPGINSAMPNSKNI